MFVLVMVSSSDGFPTVGDITCVSTCRSSLPDALEVVKDSDIGSESLEISGLVVSWDSALEFEDGRDLRNNP
jgi:hypothetical protein